MVTPSKDKRIDAAQNDPGVSNDPRSNAGDYNAHAWHSLNQIFERLGKIDQKIDQLGVDQGELKKSVDRHERVLTRAIFTVGGGIAVIVALWFIYDNFLKDRITFTPAKQESAISAQKN